MPDRAPIAPPKLCLILGGARSGKSRFAEATVLESGLRPVYLATAEARDGEMAERIRRHRARRGDAWATIEEPLEVAAAVKAHASAESILLVDCLTLWLSNLMAAGRDPRAETEKLIEAFRAAAGPSVVVTNEVGGGIVPENALARAFRDHAGSMNQAVAAAADRAVLVVAGLPVVLK